MEAANVENFYVSHGKPVWTTNHVGGISDMDSGGGNELVAGEWTRGHGT
jgi:hypothetical protein